MDLTARDIHEKQFHDSWRGYDQEEVDDFLDKVAEALDTALRERETFRRRASELEQAVATSRDTEEMLKKTLVTAQQAAEEAIGKAKAKADALVAEAGERAESANREANDRIKSLEEEVRRKNADAERAHLAKKKEYEAQIEKLRSVEAEIKTRLRAFLEQQMTALEKLGPPAEQRNGMAPEASPANQTGSGWVGGATTERPAATPSPRAAQAIRIESGRETRTAQAGRSTEPVPAVEQEGSNPRRGVRGLFSRDET